MLLNGSLIETNLLGHDQKSLTVSSTSSSLQQSSNSSPKRNENTHNNLSMTGIPNNELKVPSVTIDHGGQHSGVKGISQVLFVKYAVRD